MSPLILCRDNQKSTNKDINSIFLVVFQRWKRFVCESHTLGFVPVTCFSQQACAGNNKMWHIFTFFFLKDQIPNVIIFYKVTYANLADYLWLHKMNSLALQTLAIRTVFTLVNLFTNFMFLCVAWVSGFTQYWVLVLYYYPFAVWIVYSWWLHSLILPFTPLAEVKI